MNECGWNGYENAVFAFMVLAGIGVLLGAPFTMMILAMGWADRLDA